MITVNVHEAKTHLSRLLVRIDAGEEVVIARAGKPVARLTPYHGPSERREFGKDAGVLTVPEDFDQPLPDDVLGEFEG